MVYLIGYDLNKSGKDYNGLYDAIKSYGNWWHHLDSTWLIDTNDSIESINDKLKPHIDDNDNLLVIQLKKNYKGWLPEKAWTWLNNANF